MKMGAGVVMMALNSRSASAQEPAPQPVVVVPHTEAGWKNDASRASGNGAMDNTTGQIVRFVSSFSESNLTDPVLHALSRIMVDSIAALISGFESEPARISARLARTIRSDLKSTVLGYGVTTSPELAAFANGCMLRHADFNDFGPGLHPSNILSGILAVGEALHSTGLQVLTAVTLGYELAGALGEASTVVDGPAYTGGWDSPFEGPAVAMAVGKLMGLNEDRLANALSLALVPHMPMYVTVWGELSHWKGCHSPEAVKCAVWAALLAREGMTGPAQPFEARNGLFDHIGPFKDLRLPMSSDGQMVVQMVGSKRIPADAVAQAILELIPQIRAWTKVEDIVSIQYEMPFFQWQAVADPPKWDPQNRETADHSMPYMIARCLLDGELYLDSFTPEKFRDPAVRLLMEKITVRPNPGWTGSAPARITVRTKSGAERSWDSMGGRRHFGRGEFNTPMSGEEITAKFNRVCGFMHVADEQRDRARALWSNLQAVQDIAEPIRALAKFGQPLPL
jgi:2-methylcitrate dehydratase